MRKKTYYPIFLLIVFCTVASASRAQQLLSPANLAQLEKTCDTLAIYSDSAMSVQSDVERLNYNSQFVKKFVAALKTPHSFQFKFDTLSNITELKAPDQSFKLFTWFVPFNDGTYKFYGAIQLATKDGSLKLIPLNDDTKNISDHNIITNAKKWYGARYYDMVPVTYPGKKPYYLLLGWKGNNHKTTKKVIEVLSIEQNEAVFGRTVFEMQKGVATGNRVVFEYNKRNAMTLVFDPKSNMIVFDHLAPYEPDMVGNFEYYASDLSFDGYALNYQKLYVKENIQLRNEASALDEFYSTPRKATTLFQKSKH
jgi:hypothetical protein